MNSYHSLFDSVLAEINAYQDTTNVFILVRRERERQTALWGDQSHLPVWQTESFEATRRHCGKFADWLKELNAYRLQLGKTAWDGILLEEVYEALSEPDVEKREAELIQVAAVAVAMVEASRKARGL